MNELLDKDANEESWSHDDYSEPPSRPDILELRLEVTDPELITELAACYNIDPVEPEAECGQIVH